MDLSSFVIKAHDLRLEKQSYFAFFDFLYK